MAAILRADFYGLIYGLIYGLMRLHPPYLLCKLAAGGICNTPKGASCRPAWLPKLNWAAEHASRPKPKGGWRRPNH